MTHMWIASVSWPTFHFLWSKPLVRDCADWEKMQETHKSPMNLIGQTDGFRFRLPLKPIHWLVVYTIRTQLVPFKIHDGIITYRYLLSDFIFFLVIQIMSPIFGLPHCFGHNTHGFDASAMNLVGVKERWHSWIPTSPPLIGERAAQRARHRTRAPPEGEKTHRLWDFLFAITLAITNI